MGTKGSSGVGAVTRMSRVVKYQGMREASGALAIPEGSFSDRLLIVNNEDNHLRLYAVRSPRQVQPKVKLRGSRRAWRGIDLEAATWLNGRAIFVGSLGRDDEGKLKPARQMLLSVKLDVTANGVRVAGQVRKTDALLPALKKLDKDLRKAIGDLDERDGRLGPKDKGINLEGLATAADGASLMLGFRNPLRNRKALVVKFKNPEAVLRKKAKPKLDPPYELSLGGLGVRSMDYSAAEGAYFIVAGPVNSGNRFEIYRWKEGGKPVRILGAGESLRKLKDFTPEGLIVDPTGTRLRLFGDAGGSGETAFPSVVLTLA